MLFIVFFPIFEFKAVGGLTLWADQHGPWKRVFLEKIIYTEYINISHETQLKGGKMLPQSFIDVAEKEWQMRFRNM